MSTTAVVIVSHGEAAIAMVAAAEKVLGSLDVHTVIVNPHESKVNVELAIEAEVANIHADDLLFLIDLEGSTPFNMCCRRCKGTSVVLSGLNLPMLFKLATADRDHGALPLAEELQSTALKSIHIRRGNTNEGEKIG